MKVKVLTYNIHKGFDSSGAKLVLNNIRTVLRETGADILFLQEVIGENQNYALKHASWPSEAQYEYLADKFWDYQAYGKNAVWPDRHHGNAILSKFQINSFENIDLTVSRFEFRGLLHAVIEVEGKKVDLFNVHLNLLHRHRLKQIEKLIERALTELQGDSLILCGDFNDWGGRISHLLEDRLGLQEAFLSVTGAHAKTYPSFMPMLPLDRVYFQGASICSCKVLKGPQWKLLSDHLPVLVELEI